MKTSLTLFVSFLILSSCSMMESIKGNKEIVTEEISISDYSEINLEGSEEIIYQQKTDKEPYLKIEIDSNLKEYLKINTKGGKLTIDQLKNISPTKFRVYTNSTSISKIRISGSGIVELDDRILADNLDLAISGSGKIISKDMHSTFIEAAVSGSGQIILKGESDNVKFSISGSGGIQANDLVVKNVRCRVSGSGYVHINATDSIDAEVSGSGVITYKGTPQSISKEISGSGTIQPE